MALTSRVHIRPPNPFSLKYAPYLAASDADTVLSGGESKGIQRPVGFFLLIPGLQLAASTADQPPWRIARYQRDDLGAFGLCEPGLAPSTWAIAKPVYPLSVEAMD